MKIISAINAMISKPNKIGKIFGDPENSKFYFFVFDGKYVWSIAENKGVYYLCLYPQRKVATLSAEDYAKMLSRMRDEEQNFEDSVCYNTKELKTQEAVESFTELFKLIQERQYGVDAMLDDIIGS
jgi:hypothetical protein